MAALERTYRRFYVNLRGISQELAKLKAVVPTQLDTLAAPDVQFTDIITDEIQKANQFTKLKQQELIAEMQIAARNLTAFTSILVTQATEGLKVSHSNTQDAKQSKGNVALTSEEQHMFLTDLETILTEIAREIVHLHGFVRINFNYLCRASLIFDELFARSSSAWFMAQLIKEPFASCDVDRLLVRLSLCWEKFRYAQNIVKGIIKVGVGKEESAWKPPESFVRATTKYWVQPKHVAAAKAFIVRYVPYLIFGYSSKDMEFLVNPLVIPTSGKRADENEVKEGQLVSSVYLDSEGGHSYYTRLSRHEGAELLRCRWYGDNDGDPYKEIFIERKTHHEGWSGDSSAKERFSLPQKRVFDFLKGKVDIDEWADALAAARGVTKSDKKIANLLRLGKDISAVISAHKLQPMVRTSYLRSAFQASDNNDVRFSLDVNLCMVNEFQPNFHPDPPWCRTAEEVLGKDEVVRFPFAVLEVKLQCEQPAWVSQMLHESQATMVYKFSKFQHGMAFLHRDKIGHYGLPHWVPDFEHRGFVPGFSIPTSTKREVPTTELAYSSSTQVPAARWIPSKPIETVSGHSSNEASPLWKLKSTDLRAGNHVASAYNRLFAGDDPRRGLLLLNFYPGGKKTWSSDSAQLGLKGGPVTAKTPDPDRIIEAIHARSLNIKKLDPKSVFAGERTFLHYTHKALYISAGGIALLVWDKRSTLARLTGVLLILTGSLTLVFSYAIFTIRLSKILNRTTKELHRERLDDTRAPLVATSLMGGVLLLLLTVDIFNATTYPLSPINTKPHMVSIPHFRPTQSPIPGLPLPSQQWLPSDLPSPL